MDKYEYNIDWANIVGSKTIDNGGFIGDVLQVVRKHINESKQNGELKDEAAGAVYSQAFMQAIQQVLTYELSRGKAQKEVELLCIQKDAALKDIELKEKTYLLEERMKQEELKLRKKELELKELQINKELELKEKELELKEEELELKEKQINKEIELQTKQIEVMNKDIEVKDKELELKTVEIDLKKEQLQIQKEQLLLETRKTDSDIKLIDKQIDKINCECDNTNKMAIYQAELYKNQAKGFRDNAKQKLIDAQSKTFALLFDSAEFLDKDSIPESFNAKNIDIVFKDVSNNLEIDNLEYHNI
jgi:hypothetical protein